MATTGGGWRGWAGTGLLALLVTPSRVAALRFIRRPTASSVVPGAVARAHGRRHFLRLVASATPSGRSFRPWQTYGYRSGDAVGRRLAAEERRRFSTARSPIACASRASHSRCGRRTVLGRSRGRGAWGSCSYTSSPAPPSVPRAALRRGLLRRHLSTRSMMSTASGRMRRSRAASIRCLVASTSGRGAKRHPTAPAARRGPHRFARSESTSAARPVRSASTRMPSPGWHGAPPPARSARNRRSQGAAETLRPSRCVGCHPATLRLGACAHPLRAAQDHQHERDGEIGGAIRERAGGVGHDQPRRAGRSSAMWLVPIRSCEDSARNGPPLRTDASRDRSACRAGRPPRAGLASRSARWYCLSSGLQRTAKETARASSTSAGGGRVTITGTCRRHGR